MKKLKTMTLIMLACATVFSGCGKESAASFSFDEMEGYESAKILDEPGTYSGKYEAVIIASTGIILENSTAERILIAEEVGEGEALIRGVEVSKLDIQGGGKSSVHLKDTKADQVSADKKNGAVSVEVKEGSDIGFMEAANTNVTVEAGTNVNELTLKENSEAEVKPDAQVGTLNVTDMTAEATVGGNVGIVNAEAPESKVNVEDTGKVSKVNVGEEADNSEIQINGQVEQLNVKEPSAIVEVGETGNVINRKDSGLENQTADTNAQTDSAHKHRYTKLISETKPTCQSEGKSVYQCKYCDVTSTITKVKSQHNYVVQGTNQSICTVGGVNTFACKVCGSTMTKDLPAQGHFYDEGKVTKEPTCRKEGEKTFTCVRCEESYTEKLEKTEHAFNDIKQCTVCKVYFPSTDKNLKEILAQHRHGSITISMRNKLTLNQNAVFYDDVTIEGNGNKLHLNTSAGNDISQINANGKLVLKDLILERAENENKTWSNEYIHLKGTVDMEKVTITSAVIAEGNITMKEVTLEEKEHASVALEVNGTVEMIDSTVNATANGVTTVVVKEKSKLELSKTKINTSGENAQAMVIEPNTTVTITEGSIDASGKGSGAISIENIEVNTRDNTRPDGPGGFKYRVVEQTENILKLSNVKITSKAGPAVRVNFVNTDPEDPYMEFLAQEDVRLVEVSFKASDTSGVADTSYQVVINEEKLSDLVEVEGTKTLKPEPPKPEPAPVEPAAIEE